MIKEQKGSRGKAEPVRDDRRYADRQMIDRWMMDKFIIENWLTRSWGHVRNPQARLSSRGGHSRLESTPQAEAVTYRC